MKLYIDGDPEEPALRCATCDLGLIDAGDDPVEVTELVTSLQMHVYTCPGEQIASEGLYHSLCGTKLYHHQDRPETHHCPKCNRIVPEAEQATHELEWEGYASFNFRPRCSCGWTSEIKFLQEKYAKRAWTTHPKARK